MGVPVDNGFTMNLTDHSLWDAIMLILGHAFISWALVKWECVYRKLFSILRSRKLAGYLICVIILVLLFYRHRCMFSTIKSQPRWTMLHSNVVLVIGQWTMINGIVLLFSSIYSKGALRFVICRHYDLFEECPCECFPYSIFNEPVTFAFFLIYLGLSLLNASMVGILLSLSTLINHCSVHLLTPRFRRFISKIRTNVFGKPCTICKTSPCLCTSSQDGCNTCSETPCLCTPSPFLASRTSPVETQRAYGSCSESQNLQDPPSNSCELDYTRPCDTCGQSPCCCDAKSIRRIRKQIELEEKIRSLCRTCRELPCCCEEDFALICKDFACRICRTDPCLCIEIPTRSMKRCIEAQIDACRTCLKIPCCCSERSPLSYTLSYSPPTRTPVSECRACWESPCRCSPISSLRRRGPPPMYYACHTCRVSPCCCSSPSPPILRKSVSITHSICDESCSSSSSCSCDFDYE